MSQTLSLWPCYWRHGRLLGHIDRRQTDTVPQRALKMYFEWAFLSKVAKMFKIKEYSLICWHRTSVPARLVSPPPPHASWGGFSPSLLLSGLGFDPKHHDPRSRPFTDQFWGCSIHRSPVYFYQLPFPRTNWIWPSICCLNFAVTELRREAEY